ncbi:unnamed protein product [Diamesa hyperborea]
MLKQNDDEQICKAPSSPTEQHKHKEAFDPIGSQRVYKKTSSNQLLTLYLGTRELVSRGGYVEPLKGVIYIDPKLLVSGHKIYSQLTLTFRYGREDEEVMGLKFCNEAVIALQQLWPKTINECTNLSPLQEALAERLGKNSVPFSIDVGTVTPPSVQLLPAKRYTGAPIGTSYDVRVYTVEQSDERIQRRSTVRLGIRLIHKICPELTLATEQSQLQTVPRTLRLRLSPKARKLIKQTSLIVNGSNNSAQSNGTNGAMKTNVDTDVTDSINRGPQGSVDKPFLWAEGRVSLKASLNKSAYSHGENVNVTIDVKNESRKVVRKIRIFAVQHVDVCMFSNGKFKNIVAEVDVSKQIGPGETLHGVYSLLPVRGTTKNWIAVEGALFSTSSYDTSLAALNSKLASSAPRDEKNVFAIYVSYYVKVKLSLSSMGGEVTLKLPFILGNIEMDAEHIDKSIQVNHSNDLHLNDHQTLDEIRRPHFDRSESCSERTTEQPVDDKLFSRNSSINCKSIDYDDEAEIIKEMNLNNEGIDFINDKLNELNRSTSRSSSNSSKSNMEDNDYGKQEISVIQAQVHCQKYDESDI